MAVLKTNNKEPKSPTNEAMPTKIGFHAFPVNLYLHEFFELILYSPWSEGKLWPFLKASKKEP